MTMKMFARTAAITLAGALMATQAFAFDSTPRMHKFNNSHRVYAEVISSEPVYSEGTTRQKRVCEDVEVPIYGGSNNGDQVGNTVAGAVVGGLLGQAATGNKNGATAGALLGAAVGASKQTNRVVGYRVERQCHNETYDNSRVLYYRVRVRAEGQIYRIQLQDPMERGDTVRMYFHN